MPTIREKINEISSAASGSTIREHLALASAIQMPATVVLEGKITEEVSLKGKIAVSEENIHGVIE
jgi:hypothetical protein